MHVPLRGGPTETQWPGSTSGIPEGSCVTVAPGTETECWYRMIAQHWLSKLLLWENCSIMHTIFMRGISCCVILTKQLHRAEAKAGEQLVCRRKITEIIWLQIKTETLEAFHGNVSKANTEVGHLETSVRAGGRQLPEVVLGVQFFRSQQTFILPVIPAFQQPFQSHWWLNMLLLGCLSSFYFYAVEDKIKSFLLNVRLRSWSHS